MADKYAYPLPASTYISLAQQLYTPLLYGENAVLLCSPLYGRDHAVRYMWERVQDKRHVLGEKYHTFHFAHASITNTETNSEQLWISQLQQALLTAQTDGVWNTFTKQLDRLFKDGFEPTFFVNIPESMPDENIAKFLDLAQRIYYVRPNKVHLLLVMDMKWDEESFFRLTAPYRSLFQNTITPAQYTDREVIYFIRYWLTQWHHKLPKRAIEHIAQEAGGILLLAKAAIRVASRARVATLSGVQAITAGHLDYVVQIKFFLSQLTQSQQTILKHVANDNENNQNKEEINHLVQMQILQENGVSLGIRAASLARYLQDHPASNSMLTERVRKSQTFSHREKTILLELIRSKGQLVSREKIAKLLWNDTDAFSDWAIDQTISRIRSKMKNQPSLTSCHIHTIKRRGFVISHL